MANPPAHPDFLPFSLPDIGEEEISEVVDALRSGWLTTGPKTKLFEQDFAAYIGPGVEAVAVNSATAGLHLALEAAGIGPGDEVVTTSYTFTATAEVIRYLGANPVLVDVLTTLDKRLRWYFAPVAMERASAEPNAAIESNTFNMPETVPTSPNSGAIGTSTLSNCRFEIMLAFTREIIALRT